MERDDELDDIEEGFVLGHDSRMVKCACCGKMLTDNHFVELEVYGNDYRFCCDGCCSSFIKLNKEGKYCLF